MKKLSILFLCFLFLLITQILHSKTVSTDTSNKNAETLSDISNSTKNLSHFFPQKQNFIFNPIQNTYKLSPSIINPLLQHEYVESDFMYCRSTLNNGITFEEKINGCDRIKNSIVWQSARGDAIPYDFWPIEKKNRINEIYQSLIHSTDLGLACPNPNDNYLYYQPNSRRNLRMFLHENEAFDMYAAQVAFSIYLEVTHTVPWTILNLPQIQLDEIFNSSNYHLPVEDIHLPRGIIAGRDYQLPFRASWELNCDPRTALWFLSGMTNTSRQNLITATPLQTLVNINYWVKDNVISLHEDPAPIASVSLYQLAYLEGRLRAGTYYGRHGIPAPKGCHSVAKLIYDLAKGINIPLMNISLREYKDNFLEYPITEAVHGALVAFAGSSDEKVLYRADDITDYSTLYPLNESGAPLSNDEKKLLFFEVNWKNYSDLENWGLRIFRDLPMITNSSEDFGLVVNEAYPNYGRFLGYWNWSTYSIDHFDLYTYYETQKSYALCSWELVNDFCSQSSREDFVRIYNFQDESEPTLRGRIAHPISYHPPNTLNGDDFYNRAQLCVNNNGGCAAIRSNHNNWLTADFGLTTSR